MAGAPPFAPFIETMEEAVRIVPEAVRHALGDVAPEISTIVPSLRRAFPDIATSPELPPDQQRRLVFSAYADYLRRATQMSPAVVLFDDLHWADEPTLQLLGHLAPHVASMRLLVVGTYRDVELDVTTAVRADARITNSPAARDPDHAPTHDGIGCAGDAGGAERVGTAFRAVAGRV